ncbi:hypothetical protein D3C78_999100 [compost metagenome]
MGIAGLQPVVDQDAALHLQPGLPGQGQVRPKADRGDHQILFADAAIGQGDAPAIAGLGVYPGDAQPELQSDALAAQRLLQRLGQSSGQQGTERAVGQIQQGDLAAIARHVHRQLAANEAGPQYQDAAGMLDCPLGGGVLLLAVEGDQMLAARQVGSRRAGTGGQHQLAVRELSLSGQHHPPGGIYAQYRAVGQQRDALLLGKVAAALPGHGGGGAAPAHHVAEIRLVVLVTAVGGDETDGLLPIQLAQTLDQLLGGKAAADHHDLPAGTGVTQGCCIHTQASAPQGSNTSLPMPQPGQRKLSGTWAQGVPGASN